MPGSNTAEFHDRLKPMDSKKPFGEKTKFNKDS